MSAINPGTVFCADGHEPIHYEDKNPTCPLCRAQGANHALREHLDRKEHRITELVGTIDKLEAKLDEIRRDRE